MVTEKFKEVVGSINVLTINFQLNNTNNHECYIFVIKDYLAGF